MRLFVDEDSESKLLVRLLRESHHDVLTVMEAGLASHADTEVMALARTENRVVLTRNVREYLALHEFDPDHSGILAEYQDRESGKNMSAVSIVRAINNLDTTLLEIDGQFIALNAWAY